MKSPGKRGILAYNDHMISYPQTFIFMGRSGSGKGTQADLLRKYVEANDRERPVFYLESGAQFRNFVSQSHYTAKRSRAIMKEGGLQPSFLAIHMWSHQMIEQMDEGKHLFIDGTPRKLEETRILENALDFYEREKPVVVHINVSNEWSRARLAGRGRADDIATDEVEKRLAWFDTDVQPAIDYLKNNPKFRFVEVNGEQTIEAIHQELVAKIFNA